jgi:hypothetical protein
MCRRAIPVVIDRRTWENNRYFVEIHHGLQHGRSETISGAVRPGKTPCACAVMPPCRRHALAGQVWHPRRTSPLPAAPPCQWRACQPWRAGPLSTGGADSASARVRGHVRPPQAPRCGCLAGPRGQPCGPHVSGLAGGRPLGLCLHLANDGGPCLSVNRAALPWHSVPPGAPWACRITGSLPLSAGSWLSMTSLGRGSYSGAESVWS